MSADLFERSRPRPSLRALTLHQPWASLMAWGVKTIETRVWGTWRMGPLAIHAAKALPAYGYQACHAVDAIRQVLDLRGLDPAQLPLGRVLCVVDLVESRKVDPGDPLNWVPDLERDLGNYAVGRYGLVTDNLRVLDPPVKARGAQGFWKWEIPDGVEIEGIANG